MLVTPAAYRCAHGHASTMFPGARGADIRTVITVGELDLEHTPEAIERRLAVGPQPHYLRDVVLGAIDGVVTTFAVAAGALGAGLAAEVVVILGIANLLADGFSMAASNYLGGRAELREWGAGAPRHEERHVRTVPEGEREEIRQIFARKGLRRRPRAGGGGRHRAAAIAGRHDDAQEHGFPDHAVSPLRAGVGTFGSFIIVGAIPLVPFVAATVAGLGVTSPFTWSCAFTAVTFLGVGAPRAAWWGVRGGAPRSRRW